MSIWFATPELDKINRFAENTLVEHVDIRFTEIGDDYLRATMPVDRRTHQPMGILHGGASVVLAETLASVGANISVDPAKNYCVGLEINANHIRSVSDGLVTGTGSPVHMGKTTQIWEIRLTDEKERLTCISRVTMAVLSHIKKMPHRML
ncbi:esterase [Desulfonema ishimotonii]|uniref:Esterase n=1 Tax=Desulfonema ishimotonii TaxID=45657 RepID=A0A401G2T9_9BACT|nr:hotdog fold thioesterase [Desulfonema ishimotonii]GBC63558.1 esterase [Desulfonema ishimotonii]